MAKAKVPNVDISFANGWIRGQMAVEDSSDGFRGTAPGLKLRIRLDSILEYFEDDESVLIIITSHNPKGIAFYGHADTMDQIIAREALKEVPTNVK